ncbi:hypothetical protein ACWCYK_04175 [Streptomyces lydicamycinicus]
MAFEMDLPYTDDGPLPQQSFGPGTLAEEDFPSHVSRVPFRWETLGGTSEMAFLGGVLGIDRDGEWVRPRLGHAVVELLPEAGSWTANQRMPGRPSRQDGADTA